MSGRLADKIRSLLGLGKVPTLRDSSFDTNRTRYWFRSLLLDVVSGGGDITERTWAEAESMWQDTVAHHKRTMSTERAVRVAVTDLATSLHIQVQDRGWRLVGERWQPPTG